MGKRARLVELCAAVKARSCARKSHVEANSLQREWAIKPQSLHRTAWRLVGSPQILQSTAGV